MKSKLTYILSLAAMLALAACSDAPDLGMDLDIDQTYDDGNLFHLTVAPMVGEEVASESRAYNSMTPDRENMIQSLFVLQFDSEGNMRRMDNGQRYLYQDFITYTSTRGVSMVTEQNMPDLVLMSSSSEMHTCIIANADYDKMIALLFPTGDQDKPVTWEEFQELQFELSFATDEDIEKDSTLERGHLTKTLMFGYYKGVISKTGFTLGLGRIVSRIQVNFIPENTAYVSEDMFFFGAMHNVERSSYFFVPSNDSPHNHLPDGEIFMLDSKYIDFTENGGTITYYTAPHVGSSIKSEEDATIMNLWCVRGTWDETENAYVVTEDSWPTWDDSHISIILGSDPANGDYSLNRNTIYQYDVSMKFPVPVYADWIQFDSDYADSFGDDLEIDSDFTTGEAAITLECNVLTKGTIDIDKMLSGALKDNEVYYSLAPLAQQPASVTQEMYDWLAQQLNVTYSRANNVSSALLGDCTFEGLSQFKEGFYLSIEGNYSVKLKVNLKYTYSDLQFKDSSSLEALGVSVITPFVDAGVNDGSAVITVDGVKLVSGLDLSALFDGSAPTGYYMTTEPQGSAAIEKYSILEASLSGTTFKLADNLNKDLGGTDGDNAGFHIWLETDRYPLDLNIRIIDPLKDVNFSGLMGNASYNVGYKYNDVAFKPGVNEFDLASALRTETWDTYDKTTSDYYISNDGFFTNFKSQLKFGDDVLVDAGLIDGEDSKKYSAGDNPCVVWYDREFSPVSEKLEETTDTKYFTDRDHLKYDDGEDTFVYNQKDVFHNFWWSYDDTYDHLSKASSIVPDICEYYGIDITPEGKVVTGTNYGGFGFYLQINAYFQYAFGIKRLSSEQKFIILYINYHYIDANATWPRMSRFPNGQWI